MKQFNLKDALAGLEIVTANGYPVKLLRLEYTADEPSYFPIICRVGHPWPFFPDEIRYSLDGFPEGMQLPQRADYRLQLKPYKRTWYVNIFYDPATEEYYTGNVTDNACMSSAEQHSKKEFITMISFELEDREDDHIIDNN